MEELGGLQSMGYKESDTTERLHFTYEGQQWCLALVGSLPPVGGGMERETERGRERGPPAIPKVHSTLVLFEV